MIDIQAALCHHFFEIPIAQAVPQIPTQTQYDDFALIMSPFEYVGGGAAHGCFLRSKKLKITLTTLQAFCDRTLLLGIGQIDPDLRLIDFAHPPIVLSPGPSAPIA